MDPEEVLRVATTAYWHEGPEVSLNAVCERAGVSKPSLYREFGSEDGLTAAVLAHYAEVALEQGRDLLSSGRNFTDKLEALIEFASEDPRNANGCLFVKMRAARLKLGPLTQAKLAEIETATLELYVRLFQESRENGEWSGGLPIAFAAQYLHAQIGLALSLRARGAQPSLVRPILDVALSVLRDADEKPAIRSSVPKLRNMPE